MKQLHNILARFRRKQATDDKSSVPRITNDKVAEYREAVIAKGKRYKYPMQQTKKRTVIISSAIVVALALGVTFLTWYQLYQAQTTSQFMYRVTQILPLTVGSADGESVLYREYLLHLRSALHYFQEIESVNISSDNGQKILAYQKRQAMDKVLEQAFARKLAAQADVNVSDRDVGVFIEQQISSNDIGATRGDFETVIREYYDWTFEEYRSSIKSQLLKSKVVAAIDDDARATAETVLQKAKGKKSDFSALAKEYSADEATKQNGGDVGFAPLSGPDPEGLAAAASKLGIGQVSDIITGANGLYVIKTLDKREGEVRFARIFIGFKEFDRRFAALREQGGVREYITIPDASPATGDQ
jgi:hypothetical protein